ncbi:hypothetical protein SEA_PICKLES13_64 [Microbacterium phage Pickles13]|nr:hypothetical protein SEA_PICKLES13_64 [Microbacterium phage Pickles13]
MGVHESIGYMLRCDFPGCDFATEDMNTEYSSWTDRGYAIDEWREGDGYVGPEGVFCPTHTIWTTDEFDERVEIVPMPYTIDSLFVLAERRIDERIENAARLARVRHYQRVHSWELRDASRERRVRVRMAEPLVLDQRVTLHERKIRHSQRLVAVNAEAREALAHG